MRKMEVYKCGCSLRNQEEVIQMDKKLCQGCFKHPQLRHLKISENIPSLMHGYFNVCNCKVWAEDEWPSEKHTSVAGFCNMCLAEPDVYFVEFPKEEKNYKKSEEMTKDCEKCQNNEHVSCLLQTSFGLICRACQIMNGYWDGFACECGEWEPRFLKSMIKDGRLQKCSRCDKGIFRKNEDEHEAWKKILQGCNDSVNHPAHYQSNGMEAIDVIEAFGLTFNLGNVIKYILRAGKKDDAKQDLSKALWYLKREIDGKKSS